MKKKDKIKDKEKLGKEELMTGAFMAVILACCIAFPLLLFGGIGIAAGFVFNNLIIIAAGVIAIGFGAYLYLSKRKRIK